MTDLSQEQMLGFYGAITTAAVAGYYALMRKLEARWPWGGRLLGWKAQPRYDNARL